MREFLKILGWIFLAIFLFPFLLFLFPWALIEREEMEKENFSENQLAEDSTKMLNAKELPNAG